ncbi:GDP-mannose 4,6-dehydratase [Candidatus Woesearchaeota archaeon]|nr:GDP-mannose 4,6-dehydratase [Candidatus Woesearchaeota archaeon]
MKVFVSGGGGFIGSHVAEYYASKGHDVVVLDNLSRPKLLKKEIRNIDYNKKYLEQFKNLRFVMGDVTKTGDVLSASKDADVFFHLAAQTAVTTSVTDPDPDFQSNALGTFNVLEAARKSPKNPSVIYASTNKVYGNNPNEIGLVEKEDHYEFEPKYASGIKESFSIDHCEHTPYGCSKLTGDLYMQDYAHVYGMKTGVFRMSCIYGTRQFGVEDQGWVAWFTIATLLGKPITIYGDGKQVRDVLFVNDLVQLYDRFLSSKIKHGVFNAGGGPGNTLSLLKLLDLLEKLTGKRSKISYSDWRPSDQKVFIADIEKARKDLGWKPETNPEQGVEKLSEWVKANLNIF